ncbi:MAG TPA: iron-containing alcohol dehydrogenase [Anaeromyxobacter sp.]|nr:iron-containing alcohol dehydrogenase [Anaeromyxobacter sp.]
MDLFDALGEPIRRAFTSRRDTLPRALFYSRDAADELARLLARQIPGRSAILVADPRTFAVAGGRCEEALRSAGFSLAKHLVADPPGGGSPVCDDLTKDRLGAELGAADVIVAVGSGVVNDLCKWIAGERSVPYAVYATAASMNGYSAANVAPSIRGVKSLFRARAPLAIAADPAVIESAPFELTASGLGDAVAKPVSSADWLVNHRLIGEEFSRPVAEIIDRIEGTYVEEPERLFRRDPAAIRALFEALVYSGCAMTLQGSSAPASGGEHLVSHTLDMLGHVEGTGHDLHGRQVGVATIFAAALYQRICALESLELRPAVAPFDRALWGPIAEAVQAEHAKKRVSSEAARAALAAPGRWTALRAELVPILRSPGRIKECLSRSGAAHRIADIRCTRERFLTAVHHCGAIRGRFTSIDLAWLTGLLPGAAEEILDQWLE